MRPDLAYWLALVRFPKFGAVRMGKLIERFPSMREAFCASVPELVAAGVETKIAEVFVSVRARIDPERELEQVQALNLTIITRKDDGYPPALNTIYDPPALLYLRGTLPSPDRPHLAIVGTRAPSLYAREAIEAVVVPALPSGVVIVSGMALGVDTLAHQAAVTHRTPTVAVLGAGLDPENLYPASNRKLARDIVESGGALITEFPPGTPPYKSNFPIRNRIIAGLAKAVLVVEAQAKSGSLITAKSALESGRDVLAIPGPVHSPLSEGPNALIRMGAGIIGSSADLCQALGTTPIPKPERAAPTHPVHAPIWHLLSAPQHIDDLIRTLTLPSSVIGSALTLMEMNGDVRHLGGNVYVRG